MGDPFDESTTLGPLANQRGAEAHQKMMEAAKQKGTILTGGNVINYEATGFNLAEPTVIEAQEDNVLMYEESFAPVWTLCKFDNNEKAIHIANNSKYGLGGIVLGKDKEALQVAEAIETGMIAVNENMTSYSDLPFGGVKDSGYGRECADYGVLEFSNPKLIIQTKNK